MDALIRVDSGDNDELLGLHQWLRDERDLRGSVRLMPAPIGEEQLGGITDVIAVAVGTGGTGTVLASSLITWLQTRRSVVRLEVRRGKEKVILDIQTSERVLPLIERLLRPGDEP
jgi:hypothetical protein